MKHEDVMPEGAVIDALVIRAPRDAVCRHALEIIRAYRKEMRRRTFTFEEFMKAIPPEGVRVTFLDRREIRADAINEFAERLKETLIASGIYPVIVKNSIEKIAKEMKEGKGDA
jgi:hypothetical protein